MLKVIIKVVVGMAFFYFSFSTLSSLIIKETIYLKDEEKILASRVYSFIVALIFVFGFLLLANPFSSVFAMFLALFVILGSLFLWVICSGPRGSGISLSCVFAAMGLFFILWAGFAASFASFAEGFFGIGGTTRVLIWFFNLLFLDLVEIAVLVIYMYRLKSRWWRWPMTITVGISVLLILWRMVEAIFGICF